MIPGIVAAGGANDAAPAPLPNYHRCALLMDATGQPDGLGYVASESRYAQPISYFGAAVGIQSEKFELDGVNDAITLPHSLLWTPGSKFTIEIIGLQLDVVNTGTNQSIMSQYEVDTGLISWYLYESGGIVRFSYSINGNGTGVPNGNSVQLGPVAAGTINDFAVCWDGTRFYTFKNGVPWSSLAFSGQIFDSPGVLRIGHTRDAGVNLAFMNGRFGAVYYTKGETLFTEGVPYARRTLPIVLDNPALTDPDWANVLFLVGYDAVMGKIRDYGPMDLRVGAESGVAGAPLVTLADGTPSILFDGVNDVVRIVDDPLLEPGSSALTVEAITRHGAANDNTLISKYTASGSQRSLILRMNTSTDQLQANVSSNGVSLTAPTGGSPSGAFAETPNVFEHKAFTYDGSNVRLFANGNQVGANFAYTAGIFNGSADWLIGTVGGGGNWLNGYGTMFRVTKAARYVANFSPPTGALPIG